MRKINLKKVLSETKKFFLEHKLVMALFITVFLIGGITLYISFAYYKETKNEAIAESKVGEIPDIDVRILVENNNLNTGEKLGTYSIQSEIPDNNYTFNEELSYCSQGSDISFDDASRNIIFDTNGPEVCFAYFNITKENRYTLHVYLEKMGDDGNGTGQYEEKEVTKIPDTGYTLGDVTCENGVQAQITYDALNNKLNVENGDGAVCKVNMKVVKSDIVLNIYLQNENGGTEVSDYTPIDKVPLSGSYSLNDKSSCDNNGEIKLNGHDLEVNAPGQTTCNAYLDRQK